MPLYIRDDRVKELAGQVAALQRSTVTDAVREALVLRPKELQDERDKLRSWIHEVLAQFDAEPDLAPGFADKSIGPQAAVRSGHAVGPARDRDNDPAGRPFSGAWRDQSSSIAVGGCHRIVWRATAKAR